MQPGGTKYSLVPDEDEIEEDKTNSAKTAKKKKKQERSTAGTGRSPQNLRAHLLPALITTLSLPKRKKDMQRTPKKAQRIRSIKNTNKDIE